MNKKLRVLTILFMCISLLLLLEQAVFGGYALFSKMKKEYDDNTCRNTFSWHDIIKIFTEFIGKRFLIARFQHGVMIPRINLCIPLLGKRKPQAVGNVFDYGSVRILFLTVIDIILPYLQKHGAVIGGDRFCRVFNAGKEGIDISLLHIRLCHGIHKCLLTRD